MKRSDRGELIRNVLQVFLAEPVDRTFLTIQSADDPDDYVQFIFHDGGMLYGEVGSHGWGDASVPLDDSAARALMKLGFTGGGRRSNFKSDTLAQDPEWLAALVERAFRAAYMPHRLTDPVFATTHPKTQLWLEKMQAWTRVPELPATRRLTYVTSDGIREVLERRGLKVFTDSEGGHMAVWGWEPDYGTEVKLWFRLEDDDQVYRISAASDRPVPLDSWATAKERCNEWNSRHRWPTAAMHVITEGEPEVGYLELAAHFPVGCGASVCMLDNFTTRVVQGIFEFFTWWHSLTLSDPSRPVGRKRRSAPKDPKASGVGDSSSDNRPPRG